MNARADRVWFAACAVVYLAVATRLTDGLTRTQFENQAFAHFFDHQADALLRGDLAVEKNSVGLEAFVVDGNDHLYFGLFPALLRMPFLAVTDSFFGDVTIGSAFAAWVVFVIAIWKLTDAVTGRDLDAVAVRLWKIGVALGTPVLALAGTAWVFNEAIMWGVASCSWFQYRLWCELAESSRPNRVWLAASLLLVVLNRPTFGIGCLAVAACVVARRAWRARAVSRGEGELVAAIGAAAVVLVAPNLLRFGRLFGPPMEAQGLSMFDEHRMTMLAYTGGDYVDPRYLPTNLLAYLRPDGVSIGARFPFVEAPETIPQSFGGVIHDITYRTPSLPASATFLFLLAVVGVVMAARLLVARERDTTTGRLAVLAAAGAPAAAALTVWGFIAPRYLGDFVPLLVPLALIGLRWVARLPGRTVVTIMSVLVAWSCIASVGIALSTSYQKGYDGDIAEYLDLRGQGDVWDAGRRVDDVAGFEFERDDPPQAGDVVVLGQCEAAYFSTGEQVDPWLVAEYGASEFRREFDVGLESGVVDVAVLLASMSSVAPAGPGVVDTFDAVLSVSDGQVRIDLADELGSVPYVLDGVEPGDSFRLGITSDPVRRVLTFEVDGRAVGYGHVFTRTLYGPSGQTVVFAESVTAGGVTATPLDANAPC